MAAEDAYAIRKEEAMRMAKLAGIEIVERDSEDNFDAVLAEGDVMYDSEYVRAFLSEMANVAFSAAGDGMVIVPVKFDSTVMRGTALTVTAINSISDALRVPTPAWRILRTCVPGLMTNAEATGADVLDEYFPDNQFETVIHASSKVCEGSWHWQPVATFKPNSRPAKDYESLAEEVLYG